jgi:HK97 family phage prohead protease
LLKILETDRDREIGKGSFLRDRELYRVLAKGWDTNQKVENIVKSVKLMMSIYRDATFLEKASQVLLAFDPTLPNTRFVSKNWIRKVHEIPKDRRITFQKSASNDGHHYISGIISDTSIDRDGDRFTYSALKQMERAINEGAPLFQNHNYDISDTLGTPVRAELRGNQSNAELWAEFRLEDPDYNPNVKNLIHKLETGERLGFSIGGECGDTPPIRRGDVRELPSMNLYEVSVVGIPSNSHSYVMGHVYKSVRL